MEQAPPPDDSSPAPKNKIKTLLTSRAGFGRLLLKGNGLLTLQTSRVGRAATWLEQRRKWSVPGAALLVVLLLLILELGHLLLYYQPPLSSLEIGRQLYNSGHYTAAATELRQDVTDPAAKLLLAQDLIALHQWPAANAYLNELLKANPNDPTLYFWIGQAQLGNNQPDAAATSWNLIIGRSDAAARAVQPKAQVALGSLRYRQEQYPEAARLLYAALSGKNLEATEQQQAEYLYGVLLARDLRFTEALPLLQQAATASLPGSQWDSAPLQVVLNQDTAKAQTLLDQLPLAAAEKTDGAKRARLAYAFILAEEYTPAEEQLAQVLQIAPTFTDARAYLGIVYWRTGRIDKARNALNMALTQSPANRLARQSMAELIIDQLPTLQLQGEDSQAYKQQSDQAQALLNGLITEKPDDATLQITLAHFYIARHDYQQAQLAYQTALDLNHQKPVDGLNPAATLSRYYSEIAFDPCVRGVDNGMAATRDLPSDADSWFAAGLAYSLCGYYDKATPYLERAFDLRPYSLDIIYRLALAYDATKQTEKADRLYQLLADLAPDQVYQRP
jgi:tetratricopeptide (TPR) repeat protein